MEQVIGGRLAAEALIERGVEYVFTLSGGHITPIYQYSGRIAGRPFRYPA